MAAILVDTNVLIYLFDRSNPIKQQRAIELFKNRSFVARAVVSAQTLSEFANATTRTKNRLLSHEEALIHLENFVRDIRTIPVTQQIVLHALRGVIRYQMAYFDAQLWATAVLNQIPAVFSEDFNTGAMIEGVEFVNPFDKDFDLEDWI